MSNYEEYEEEFAYLDAIRDSGEVNMFGSVSYLTNEFDISEVAAARILETWMRVGYPRGLEPSDEKTNFTKFYRLLFTISVHCEPKYRDGSDNMIAASSLEQAKEQGTKILQEQVKKLAESISDDTAWANNAYISDSEIVQCSIAGVFDPIAYPDHETLPHEGESF